MRVHGYYATSVRRYAVPGDQEVNINVSERRWIVEERPHPRACVKLTLFSVCDPWGFMTLCTELIVDGTRLSLVLLFSCSGMPCPKLAARLK